MYATAYADALDGTELDPVASFPVARAVRHHPGEPLPWADDAILWIPGEDPLFGKRRIGSRLAEDPDLLPVGLGGEVEVAPAERHALEHGLGLRNGRTLRYLRVWTRARTGDWRVAREVWGEADNPSLLL